MGVIIFFLTWFGIGFLSMFGMWVVDMRGKEFDKHYFDNDTMFMSFMTFLMGYVSLIIFICYLCHEYIPFTKIIYKIANIGIKKSDKKES